MTYFVTGATGFVGSAVTRALLARNLPVRVLVRPSSDRTNLEGLSVEIAEGDLCDLTALKKAMAGCTAVFHIAADYRHWARNWADLYRANVGGTENVIRAMRDLSISRLVYTSTVGAMGIASTGAPADETTPVCLESVVGHYHRSKFLAAERVHVAAAAGLNATIVSPTMPVGPRDIKPTPTGRIIVEAAMGRLPAYVDTGLNIAHVEDVAEGHLMALDRGAPGETYILGGDNITLRDFLVMIAGAMGNSRAPVRLPYLAAYPVAWFSEAVAAATGRCPVASLDEVRLASQKMYFSSARAMHDLGYRARPARNAVNDAVQWFAEHGVIGHPGRPLRNARPDLARDTQSAPDPHLTDV